MKKIAQHLFIFCMPLFAAFAATAQTTIITDGAWKGVGNSIASNGNAWLFPGYDDSSWPLVEAPNAANVIPVVPGSQSIWVLPYSDTAKMRKTFVVPVGDLYGGSISINADNEFELYFNGVSQGFYNNWMGGPYVFNISPVLVGCAENVIAINAANWGGPYGASLSTTLTVTNPLNTPNALQESSVSCTSFTANWDSVSTADLYLLDVSTDPFFGSFYSVYHDYNVGSALSFILNSLPPGVVYYYRLRCQRTNGLGTLVSCYSNVIQVDLNNPTISYSAPDTLCAGQTITLQITAPGSTMSWVGPNGFSSTDSVSNIANTTALNSGNYIYTVNYPGCPPIMDTVQIEIIDNPPLAITPAGPYCSTDLSDTLASNLSNVAWSGAGITNNALGYFSPGVAGGGAHTITIISGGHCPDTATTSITVNMNGGYTITGSDTICEGEDIILNSTSGIGSGVLWTGPNGYNSTNNNNTIAQATNNQSGSYILTVTYTSCPSQPDTLNVLVVNYSNPLITPAGPFCNNDSPVILTSNPAGGFWGGNGITNASTGSFDPTLAGTGTQNITYIIPGHCPDTAIASIMVANNVPLSSVVFPNVFTPNADNQNEVYSPIVPVGGHYQLTIFDRWGVQLMLADTDIGWDGKIGNTLANEGVYYWICKITSDCSPEPFIEKGFLQLFKP